MDNNMIFNKGILFVGDLHLHTKELRTTKKYVENNMVMLDNLYNEVNANENIRYVVLLGDIQHKTPTGKNTLYETNKWRTRLRDIGEILKSRYSKFEKEDNISIILRDVPLLNYNNSTELNFEEQLATGEVLPLFTLQGNHDIDKDEEYTFFTQCIEDGTLVNPSQILTNEVVLNMHNYGEADKEYSVPTEYSNSKIVGVYHDMIPMGEIETWLLLEFNKKYPNTNSDKILSRVDLAIVGHNHKHIPPTEYIYEEGLPTTFVNEVPIIWYIGSMGRTSFVKGQIRDNGYCGLVNMENIELQAIIEVPLIPKEQFFSYEDSLKLQQRNRDFKDFTLSKENTVIQDIHPKEVIVNTVKDKEIRELCLLIMDKVINA